MLDRNPINKTIVRIKGEQLLPKAAVSGNNIEKKCLDFMTTYHEDFLIESPVDEFSVFSREKDNLGYTHVKLDQKYKNIPVWNGRVIMHFDSDNKLYLVQGDYFPTPSEVDIHSGMDKDMLLREAAKQNPPIAKTSYAAHKIIFFKDDKEPRLAYELTPVNSKTLGAEIYVVDAQTGEMLNRLPTIQTIRTLR